MALRGDELSPKMTEVWLGDLLKKFDSGRTSLDVTETVLFIVTGVIPMSAINNQPKFKSIKEFDLSVDEILGSLDEENFRSLIKILRHESEYLNRFIYKSVRQLEDALQDLAKGFDHEIPISTETTKRYSIVHAKISFLVTEFSSVLSNLISLLSTDSISAIVGISGKYRDYLAQYLDELSRSTKYIEDYRASLIQRIQE